MGNADGMNELWIWGPLMVNLHSSPQKKIDWLCTDYVTVVLRYFLLQVPHTAYVKPCHNCNGMGRKTCSRCNGGGRVSYYRKCSNLIPIYYLPCSSKYTIIITISMNIFKNTEFCLSLNILYNMKEYL